MRKPGISLAWAGIVCALLAVSSHAQQLARTTVSDTVYRADGSTASGTVLISWPALPMSLILEASLGPVKDQGREGSCFAFAGAGHREFLFRNYHRYEKQTAMVAATEAVFAAQYLFYRVHELEGTLREDCGGQLGSVFKVLDSVGICLEKNSAYSPAAAWTTPTAMQDAEAASFQAGAYHRLNTVDDMKSCLASGYTFVAGFAMHVSFQKENWLATGVMPVPSTTEPVLGGHAVLFFGYDDDRKAFRARSSWGAGMEPRWKFLVPLPSGGRSQHTLGCVDATLGQGLVMMEVLRVPRRRTSHVT